MPLKHVQQRQY